MIHPIVAQDLHTIATSIRAEAAALAGKTLVITGGAGFLGSYMVATIDLLNRAALTAPCRVVCVDNYLTGSRKNLLTELDSPFLSFVTHDVRHPLELPYPADYLIHAAGVASPVYYKKFPLDTIEGTILGVKHMLEYARANRETVRGVLYFSSSEIYGDPDPNFIPTPETYKGNVSSIGPRACYDESKRLGETYCMTYFSQFRVPVKIVRPFNVYGPGMKLNDFRVIPNFIAHGLRGAALPVHDKGNQTRAFCYVTDAVTGFLKVLLSGRDGEVYNVGNDTEELNMLALAEKVAELFPSGKAQLVNYPANYPTDEPSRRCPDLRKAKGELGYIPVVDLRAGLERSLSWFRDVAVAGEQA